MRTSYAEDLFNRSLRALKQLGVGVRVITMYGNGEQWQLLELPGTVWEDGLLRVDEAISENGTKEQFAELGWEIIDV